MVLKISDDYESSSLSYMLVSTCINKSIVGTVVSLAHDRRREVTAMSLKTYLRLESTNYVLL